MGVPSMPELLVILLIVLLLFGAKKIPELAKGLGGGIKSFKKAMSEDETEAKPAEKIEADKTAKTETTATDSTKA